MASFSAYLLVGAAKYRLHTYDLAINQQTDSLGRPASPVFGGIITCTLDAPNDGFLNQWMFSPTMQIDGKIMLVQDVPESTLKTVSFFNAYCINLDIQFRPGAGGAGSLVNTVRISPQRVAVGAIVLDNNWPLASHGAGETFTRQEFARLAAVPPKPPKPPICADIAASTDMRKSKKERYDARLSVIDASSAKLKATNLRPSAGVMAADATRVAGPNRNGSPSADTMYAQAAVANKRFELNNRAIERAKLSNAIYLMDKKKYYEGLTPPQPEKFKAMLAAQTWPTEKNGLPEGWGMIERSRSGVEPVYAVYQSTFERNPKPVLIFRGTDNAVNAMGDWGTNLAQGNGFETKQYNGTINVARELSRTYNKQYGGMEIAGHSKAGGQAATAGIVTGIKTYTFNAAGVHPRTLSRAGNFTLDMAKRVGADGRPVVDAFNFPFDVLNNLQDSAMPTIKGGLLLAPHPVAKGAGAALILNNTMPGAAGVRHVVPAQDILGKAINSPWNPLKRVDYHGMPYLIDSMEKQKKDDLKTLSAYMGCQ